MQPEQRKPKIDASAGVASPLGVMISQQDRETMSMVREAIDTRRMRLAYQPVVLARDPDRVAFHEGLIRVLDSNGRVIPAKDFIGAVEDTDIGREIDCIALELGLGTLARHPSMRLSINMSATAAGRTARRMSEPVPGTRRDGCLVKCLAPGLPGFWVRGPERRRAPAGALRATDMEGAG